MMVCAYTWYLSLPLTTLSANTGIYNSACVFVYLFSCILLNERITVGKVLSVLVCISGVVVMAYAQYRQTPKEQRGNNGTWLGYVFVVASTVLYALYEVLYKKFALSAEPKSKNEVSRANDSHEASTDSTFDTMLFLGSAGVQTLFWYWPIILILHYSGYETFEMPSKDVWEVLSVNGALDCAFNILLLITIMLTNPLFVSVGSLLTIPASIVADKLFRHYVPNALSFVGAGLIVLGFVGLNLAEHLYAKKMKRRSEDILSVNFEKKFWRDRLY